MSKYNVMKFGDWETAVAYLNEKDIDWLHVYEFGRDIDEMIILVYMEDW